MKSPGVGDHDPINPDPGNTGPDAGRKVTVFNMATSEEKVYVGLSIKDALIAASEQAKGNFNTWDYPKAEDVAFLETPDTIGLGDFSALQEEKPEAQGPLMNPLLDAAPSPLASEALAGLTKGDLVDQERRAVALALSVLLGIRDEDKSVSGLIFTQWQTGDQDEPVWYRTQLERNGIKALGPLDEEVELDPAIAWPEIERAVLKGFRFKHDESFDARLSPSGDLELALSMPTIKAFKDRKPLKKEASMARRAEALHSALGEFKHRFNNGSRRFEAMKSEDPKWMHNVVDIVMARVMGRLGADLTDQGKSHFLSALSEAAWAIHLNSDTEMPEKAAEHAILNAPTGAGELAEWAGAAGRGVELLVQSWKDRTQRYTEHDARVEAYQDFMDIVGIELCHELREGAGSINPTIPQDSKGMPQAFAWPGGYPLYYLAKDNGVLSVEAVTENLELTNDPYDPQWFVSGVEINYEDPYLFCDHTGARIPSAYREDEANGFPDETKATQAIADQAHAENPKIIGIRYDLLSEKGAKEPGFRVSAIFEGWKNVALDNLQETATAPILLAERGRLLRMAEEMLTPCVEGRGELEWIEFRAAVEVKGEPS